MSTRRTTRRSTQHGSPLTPFLFLAPYLLLFTAFVAVPAVFGLWISAHDWDYLLDHRPFVGFGNYANLLDPDSVAFGDFWNGMTNTALFTVVSVPFLLSIPLGVAMLLHMKFPGRTFFRAVFFAPYVLGVAVIGLMWRYLLDGNFGLVNAILGTDISWTTSQPWAWIALVAVTVWWTMGFNAIIYLAGLGDIPPDHYEAAALDGANALQRFRHITIPGIQPVFVFVAVTTILASANMFGQSYLITQGGPSQSTQTALMVITELGLSRFQMGQAAAQSYVLAFFLGIISILTFLATRDRDQARERRALRKGVRGVAR
ncbi:carbohydrate ABC transporter permease [Ruania halotolerans]|uniref:carbohydrate ABC transporter permease n=1 Tax=Ruania halotolerans TaxID=2897773 RepID=UPI001E28D03D|nr:sugar ABC transporter permease [Ruania halotolerans]UFU07988.1 sugar ABC transporter permease [Ruania halotolerans]